MVVNTRAPLVPGGGTIKLSDVGQLVHPVAICAFEGWNDAAEAASGVVNHLSVEWESTPVASIDPDDYYDFQVNRPVIDVVNGTAERLVWPTTRLSLARRGETGLPRDMVLVHGIEPNMRWRGFTDELLDSFRELGIELVLIIGALLADSPHTRPVPIQVSGPDGALTRGLATEPSDYKGSSGIVGVLQYSLSASGESIPAVSLWASVPHYVATSPSPKATLALLRTVEDILDAPLPAGDLEEEARAWQRGVEELAQQDSDVADYVRTLEEAKDATDLPEASGDAIAREFERYLRRRGDASDGE
ncbi:MAG TPA: PAC2 family protein [Trebonia sp.]|nr:PAC2 family protein [Trebonia sp.]